MDIKKIVEEYQNNTSFDFNDYLNNFSNKKTGGSINKTKTFKERKNYYNKKINKNNNNINTTEKKTEKPIQKNNPINNTEIQKPVNQNIQKSIENKPNNSEKPITNNTNNNKNPLNNEEKKITYIKDTSNTQLKKQVKNLQNPKELGQLVSGMRQAGESKEKINLVLNRGKGQFNLNNPVKKEIANKTESNIKEKIEQNNNKNKQKSENTNNFPRRDDEEKELKNHLKQNINKTKVEERHTKKINNVIEKYEKATPEKREEYKNLLNEQLSNGNLTANGKAVREKALAEIKNSDEKLRAKKDIDELLAKGDKKNAEFLINRYEKRTGKKLGYNLNENSNESGINIGSDITNGNIKNTQKTNTENNTNLTKEQKDNNEKVPFDQNEYDKTLDKIKNIKDPEVLQAYKDSLLKNAVTMDSATRNAIEKAIKTNEDETNVENNEKQNKELNKNTQQQSETTNTNEQEKTQNNTQNTNTQNQNDAVSAMGKAWGSGNKEENKNNNTTNTADSSNNNEDDDEDKPKGFINQANEAATKKIDEIAEKAKKGELNKEDNEFLAKQIKGSGGVSKYFNEINKETKKRYDKSMGLGKTMALAGAVFGAMAEHKRRLRQWEADYQYAVANGMPPPRKPGFFGSMVMGGTKGAALGATGAFLAKRTGMGKSVHNTIKDFTGNMAVSNYVNNKKAKGIKITEEDYTDAKTYKGLQTDEERKHFIHERTKNKINNTLNSIKNSEDISKNDYDFIKKNKWDLHDNGYLRPLYDQYGVTSLDELMKKLKENRTKNFSEELEEMNFSGQLEFSNYLSVCFSLSAKIEENAKVEIEELENYYNAFHNIFPELDMDVKEFLTECVLFPDFLKFVKKVTKDEKMLEYIQLKDQNFSERINNIIKFKQESILENEKLYNNYCSLFNKEPNKDKFLDMLKRYDEFKAYIIEKIANTKLLNFSLGIVKMPENVDIESDVNNAPVLPQGASQESLSKISENTQKTQDSLNSKDAANKEKKKELEQQAKEKEKKIEFQNKKEAFTKEQNGKLQEKLQNLTAKKSELQNKLANNRQNMPVEKISQLGDKITGLNLKMQQARKDTKAKIEGFGTKKK